MKLAFNGRSRAARRDEFAPDCPLQRRVWCEPIFGDETIDGCRGFRQRRPSAAAEVSPYCHAKIAATILTGDEDGGPVRIARAADRFADLTDEAAERFVRAIARGEMTIEDVDAELTD